MLLTVYSFVYLSVIEWQGLDWSYIEDCRHYLNTLISLQVECPHPKTFNSALFKGQNNTTFMKRIINYCATASWTLSFISFIGMVIRHRISSSVNHTLKGKPYLVLTCLHRLTLEVTVFYQYGRSELYLKIVIYIYLPCRQAWSLQLTLCIDRTWRVKTSM